jgi:hypothetical protein
MKKNSILFLMTLFFIGFTKAQTTPSSTTATTDNEATKDSTKKSPVEEKLDAVLKKLAVLEDKEEKQNIGVIYFRPIASKKYPCYIGSGGKDSEITIDRAAFVVKDGFIVDIKVFSGYSIFINNQAPIALTSSRFDNRHTDKLYDRSGHYIIVQELLFLDVKNGYIPDDAEFELKGKDSLYTLTRNVGINTVFDIRAYSDGLGLIGSQPNGIAQTDLHIKQILHRHNLGNQGKFIGQYFKARINVAKFDSKDRSIDSLVYSRSRFVQKSFANAEASMNVFNGWLFEKKSSNIYYCDLGGGLNIGRLSKDTAKQEREFILPFWFLEGGINLKASDNIGINAYGRYVKSYLIKNDYVSESNEMEFFNAGAEVFFNPVRSKSNRFFARFNWTISTTGYDKKNNFVQLQLGYSVLLTQLLESKK